jgi:hypothetical protein
MNERFFQSPQPIEFREETPLIFLEGPVQGAANWQTPFAHSLLEAVPGIAVASPRALPEHEANFESLDPTIKARTSDKQVAYEFLARRLAFNFGAIVLWYAAQDPGVRYPEGRPYAKTSEKETGEVWGYLAAHPDYPFAFGVDPGYKAGTHNSMGYIRRNNALMDIAEHTTLDALFDATVKAAEQAKALGSRPVPSLASQSIQRAWDLLDSE